MEKFIICYGYFNFDYCENNQERINEILETSDLQYFADYEKFNTYKDALKLEKEMCKQYATRTQAERKQGTNSPAVLYLNTKNNNYRIHLF